MSKEVVKRKKRTPAWIIGAKGDVDVVVIYYMTDCFEYSMQSHTYVVGLVGLSGEQIPAWNASCSAAKKEHGKQYKLWGRRDMVEQGDNR